MRHSIRPKETAIQLVMINGVARYGIPELMRALGADGQSLLVGGETRRLFLEQNTADPQVANVSLSAARSALGEAFHGLPKLARDPEKPKPKKLDGLRSTRRSRWCGRWRSMKFRPPESIYVHGYRSTARATSRGLSVSR